MAVAVYPGSFDPVTSGHADVIARSARTFEEVVVSVGRNSGKTPLFSVDERLEMLREVCAPWPNVRVDSFDGMLVNYARACGATVIIKGLRAVSDFEYEFQMALMNRHQAPTIETVFLMPDEKYVYLSSSIIKEVGRLKGDLAKFLPQEVVKALRRKFASQL